MAALTPEQFLQLQSPGSVTKDRIYDVTAIASDVTIAPTTFMTRVSGTAAIDTITLPGDDFAGSIELIPTGVFTWTTDGNIGLAGTAVVGKSLRMTYHPVAGKWYPSYIA